MSASHAAVPTAHFTPALFEFLRDLRANNDREWFQANKARYEQAVREPLLQFIADFGPRLERISPAFVADPRPVGGSMFRIYRDTRFSRDKSPYKTHAAVQFRHQAGRDAHAPGFYLHLEPGSVFAGVGLWHPDADTLRKLRGAIMEHPERWQAAVGDAAFARRYRLEGESVRRPPAGVPADHPLLEDLKRKDFIAACQFSEAEACRPDFLDRYAQTCADAAPFMRFLTAAVGVEF